MARLLVALFSVSLFFSFDAAVAQEKIGGKASPYSIRHHVRAYSKEISVRNDLSKLNSARLTRRLWRRARALPRFSPATFVRETKGGEQTLRIPKNPDGFTTKALSPVLRGNLSLVRHNPRNSPDNPGLYSHCADSALMEVVSINMTYGETDVAPVRLDCQFGADPRIEMMGGQDLVEGMQETFLLPAPGESIKFIGRAAYPTFDQYFYYKERGSDDGGYAMVLVRGDNFYDIAASKGVSDPYMGQLSIEDILQNEGYIDQNGVITIGATEVLIAYELGTGSPGGVGFDFNDLLVKIDADCPVLEEIVVKDRICPNYECSGDENGLNSHGGEPDNYSIAATTFIPPVDGVLSEVSGLFFGLTFGGPEPVPGIDWVGTGYGVRVFDSPAAFIADPVEGNIGEWGFDDPSNPDYVNPVFTTSTPIGDVDKHILTFDLSTLGIQLNAGQQYVVAISGANLGAPFEVPHFSFSEQTLGGFGAGLGMAGQRVGGVQYYGPDFIDQIWPDQAYFASRVVMQPN